MFKQIGGLFEILLFNCNRLTHLAYGEQYFQFKYRHRVSQISHIGCLLADLQIKTLLFLSFEVK